MFDKSDDLTLATYRRLDSGDDPHRDIDPTEEMNLASLDLFEDRQLSVTLPVSAAMAYEVFCDIEQIPRWVSIVSSVQILEATPRGRARRAAFMADLNGGSIGYTLEYEYRNADRICSWWTPDQPQMRVGGRAQFNPLGDRACLMSYELYVDIPSGVTAGWNDPYFDGHAPSAVLGDFRDYLSRIVKKIQ